MIVPRAVETSMRARSNSCEQELPAPHVAGATGAPRTAYPPAVRYGVAIPVGIAWAFEPAATMRPPSNRCVHPPPAHTASLWGYPIAPADMPFALQAWKIPPTTAVAPPPEKNAARAKVWAHLSPAEQTSGPRAPPRATPPAASQVYWMCCPTSDPPTESAAITPPSNDCAQVESAAQTGTPVGNPGLPSMKPRFRHIDSTTDGTPNTPREGNQKIVPPAKDCWQ